MRSSFSNYSLYSHDYDGSAEKILELPFNCIFFKCGIFAHVKRSTRISECTFFIIKIAMNSKKSTFTSTRSGIDDSIWYDTIRFYAHFSRPNCSEGLNDSEPPFLQILKRVKSCIQRKRGEFDYVASDIRQPIISM